MKFLSSDADATIEFMSGVLRVEIEPKMSWLLIVSEILGITFFDAAVYRQWGRSPVWSKGILVWASIAGFGAMLYQLSGSEEIEFTAGTLSIRKIVLGVGRTAKFPVELCKDLEWGGSRGESPSFHCKIGWRTIHFGKYLSDQDAQNVLVALQTNLPETARKMGALAEPAKSLITLKLT